MAEPNVKILPFAGGLVIQAVPEHPQALLLTNNLGSTLIAYTVRALCTPESGEAYSLLRVLYNFGVHSNGVEIPAGATRLVTPADTPLNGLSSVTLSIDLVILDSGQVLGPDEGGSLAGLEGVLSASEEIRTILAQDRSREEFEAEFTRRCNEEREKPGRAAMMRGAEFRLFANLARQSQDHLFREIAKREANVRLLSLHR